MNLRVLLVAISLALPAVAVEGASLAAPAAEGVKAAKAGRAAVDGAFARYVVSPRGDVLGMMLADGTVVLTGFKGTPSLRVGQVVHVEGKAKASGATKVVTHAVVSRGGVVVSEARAAKVKLAAKATLQKMGLKARVIAVIPGHHGSARGVVLADGTTAMFGHASREGAHDVAVRVGDIVSVEGKGAAYPQGRGLQVTSIKLASGETRTFSSKKGHHAADAAADPR